MACYNFLMSTAARLDESALPPEWREHYAILAAAYVRERGMLPPSLDALAKWADAPVDATVDEAAAWLEGRGPDPCSKSG